MFQNQLPGTAPDVRSITPAMDPCPFFPQPLHPHLETDAEKRERLIKRPESGCSRTHPTDSDRAIMTDVQEVHCDVDLCDFSFLASFLAVVAFRRCADHILIAIDMEFVRGFGEDLGGLLFQELCISSPETDESRSENTEPADIIIINSGGWTTQLMHRGINLQIFIWEMGAFLRTNRLRYDLGRKFTLLPEKSYDYRLYSSPAFPIPMLLLFDLAAPE
jgi:hypothetical protein